MPSLEKTTLHALSSSNVVLGDEVVVATVVYSSPAGKIVKIIREDSVAIPVAQPAESNSDDEIAEYYDQDLEALGVLPENHRDIGDLVLMPGLVDAHVHLNEVSLNTDFNGDTFCDDFY